MRRLPILFLVASPALLGGQKPPAFEVASIKLNTSGDSRPLGHRRRGGARSSRCLVATDDEGPARRTLPASSTSRAAGAAYLSARVRAKRSTSRPKTSHDGMCARCSRLREHFWKHE